MEGLGDGKIHSNVRVKKLLTRKRYSKTISNIFAAILLLSS